MLIFPGFDRQMRIVKRDPRTLRADAVVTVSAEECPGEASLHPGEGPWSSRCEIRTAVPVWQGGTEGEPAILRSCYAASLELAAEQGCSTLATPLLGAESGFPPEKALEIGVTCIEEFQQRNRMSVILAIWGDAKKALAGVIVPGAQQFPAKPQRAEKKANAALGNARRVSEERDELPTFHALKNPAPRPAEMMDVCCEALPSLPEDIPEPVLGESFAQKVLRLGEERGMSDPEIYKAAGLSRAAFNKIINGRTQNPSRQTVCAIAIALKLDEEEAVSLMAAAGLAFADNNPFDIIVRSCIRSGFYDLWKINCALADRNLPLLGSNMI